jgi:hypothetical protein
MAIAKGPTSTPIWEETFIAAADLSTKQYYFVELTAARTVNVCNAATDKPVGVLQNKPQSGEEAKVMIVGKTPVDSDSALAVGDLIGTAADGQADAKVPGTDTSNYVVGMVTIASGAAGEKAEALINCANPHRAA